MLRLRRHASPTRAPGRLLGLALAASLLFTGCAGPPAGHDELALRLSAGNSRLWRHGLIELDLDVPVPVDNPFDPAQADLTVTFMPARGEPVAVPAFYYQEHDAARRPLGPPGWKARFSPPHSGVWVARAGLRTPDAQRDSRPLAILVAEGAAPAARRGFVRVDPRHPRHLAFESGEPFLPIGLNLGWWNGDALADYERWFDALQRNGATAARLWMSSWAFGLEWHDTGLGDYTRRLDRAWLLDQVLRMAEQRGIYIVLVLVNHGAFSRTVNPEWGANPYNRALGGPCLEPQDFLTDPGARDLFQRRLRYIAARWAYSPNLLAWEWWNEVDLAGTGMGEPELIQPWIEEMTAALRRYDPNRRLTTISYARGTPDRVARMPEIDLLQRHEYNARDPYVVMPLVYAEMAALAPKPILFGEFGRSPGGEQDEATSPDAQHFHNGLWASALSGFAMPAMYWWWDNYIEPNGHWRHLGGLSAFLAGEDLAALSPVAVTVTANVTTVVTLALGGEARAIAWVRNSRYNAEAGAEEVRRILLSGRSLPGDWRYQPPAVSGAMVHLRGLQPGRYRAEWFDTISAERLAGETAVASGGRLSLEVPAFIRDLALRVVRLP